MQCSIADLNLYDPLVNVNMNSIAFAHGGDWPAERGFWRHVSHHQAASSAAEASVGE